MFSLTTKARWINRTQDWYNTSCSRLTPFQEGHSQEVRTVIVTLEGGFSEHEDAGNGGVEVDTGQHESKRTARK